MTKKKSEASAGDDGVQTFQKPTAKPATTGATVTVSLKHPTGIILEVFAEAEGYEPVMGGGTRTVKVFRSTGQRFPLNGNRVPFGMTPNFQIIGGYALTPGIPLEVWKIWRSQHLDHPLVMNGLITAHESADDAGDEARENAGLRSNMEALNRTSDPRVPKKKTREGKFVSTIVEADEQAAA